MKTAVLSVALLCGSVASAQSLGNVLRDGIVLGGGKQDGKRPSAPGSSPSPPSAPPSAQTAVTPSAATGTHRDPDGFRVSLPASWSVEKGERGFVSVASQDRSEFVAILPLLSRTADCASTLRGAFANRWNLFPGAADVNVAATGRGLGVARFRFRGGQSQGAALCAETGKRSAMIYAMAAPASQFANSRGRLLGVLKSFRYEAAQQRAQAGSTAPMPRMEAWREPSEGAFTAEKPAGWRVDGGVLRISNNDVRTGHRLTSPDGSSALILGDVRLNKCIIPGQSTYGTQQPMQGVEWCQPRNGEQAAEEYVQRAAGEWGIQGLRVVSRRPRQDLVSGIPTPPGFQYFSGEVIFAGQRGGRPVAGAMIGTVLLLQSPSPQLMGGQYTREVAGYFGPAENEGQMAALYGRVANSVRWNAQWVMANRAAGQADHQAVMRSLEHSRQVGQRMFEDRMASADRRARGVDDVLSGTVRLTDGQGNHYRARAGSNYYFRDDDAARVESDPDRTVIGTDVWAQDGSVNLTPLEVVQ